MWLLRADPLERQLVLEVIKEASEMAERRDKFLANSIINELAQALDRGNK